MLEYESVMLDHVLEIHRNIFTVNWNIGNQCNYRCSYCTDSLNGGSAGWLDFDQIIRFADQVINHYSKDKRIVFEFTGGEVTLYQDLYHVLKYLKDQKCDTSILSNGSPKLSYWEKMKDVLDYVTLSFHAERGDPGHFYSIVEYLHQHGNVHVNIMMHNQLFEICRRLGEKMLDSFDDLSLSFQPLLRNLTNETKLMDYTVEQMDFIKELDAARQRKMSVTKKRYKGAMREYFLDGRFNDTSTERFIAGRKNHWRGWLCWAGLEQIIVTQEGKVFRAWCLQDMLGDIHDKIEFPTDPVICTKSNCHCNLDIATKKQRQIFIKPENIKEMSEIGVL